MKRHADECGADIFTYYWECTAKLGIILGHADNLSQTLLIEWVIFTLSTFAILDDFADVTFLALTSLSKHSLADLVVLSMTLLLTPLPDFPASGIEHGMEDARPLATTVGTDTSWSWDGSTGSASVNYYLQATNREDLQHGACGHWLVLAPLVQRRPNQAHESPLENIADPACAWFG